MKISKSKMQIVMAIILIVCSFIGIYVFESSGKKAVAEIWFPCVTIIGIYGLTYGIRDYKKEKLSGEKL